MLGYDRIDVSEEIDVNKTDGFCGYIICHYWYFLNINFRFDPKICNGCHGSIQKAVSFNDVEIGFR